MKSRLIVCCVFLFGWLGLNAQQNPDVINYINTYKAVAMAEMVRTGVPASITLAQGIHESESGKSNLVQRSNNHFGIKCKTGWDGPRVFHDDDERGECFRSYTSADQSYRDHSDFLKNGQRYAFLFALDPEDYKAWANGLKKAGYATNIRYSQILIKLIEDYNLQQYSLIAMGKLSPDKEMLAGLPGTQQTGPGTSTGPASPEPVAEPETAELPAIDYPTGVFRINDTRVVYAQAGTALLSIAEEHGVSLARLLDFNDLYTGDILRKGQLIYLQRKRKKGNAPFHIVQKGEDLYSICQTEGIRMESLLEYNLLREGQEPAAGEKLSLQERAVQQPALRGSLPVPAVPTAKQLPEAQEKTEPATPSFIKHTVQEKETLYAIARRYGTTVDQLKNWNQLKTGLLHKGQQLIIYNQ